MVFIYTIQLFQGEAYIGFPSYTPGICPDKVTSPLAGCGKVNLEDRAVGRRVSFARVGVRRL